MQKRVSPKDKVKVFLIFPNQPWLVNWVHQMDGQCSLGPAVAPASSRPIWSRPVSGITAKAHQGAACFQRDPKG